MKSLVKQIVTNTRGTATIELGLLCMCIVIGLIAAIAGLGGANDDKWTSVFNKASEAIATS